MLSAHRATHSFLTKAKWWKTTRHLLDVRPVVSSRDCWSIFCIHASTDTKCVVGCWTNMNHNPVCCIIIKMLSEIYFSVLFSWHTSFLLQDGRHTVRTDSEPKPSTTHQQEGLLVQCGAVHCGPCRSFWPMNGCWLYLFPLKTKSMF